MAKQIKQFRYYQRGSNLNYPNSNGEIIARENLENGDIFKPYFPISQLGIQGLPGTKVYLNNNTHSVIVGLTGTYELNLNGKAEINALSFDYTSLNAIEENDNAYIIVDIVYENGEG